jgi:D-amino-acid oxidase
MPHEAVVLGCGVIGLTSAIRLLENGFGVTIVTRDLPPNTTSIAAGAYWYGSISGRARQWARASLDEYIRLATLDRSGVRMTKLREVASAPMDDPWFKDLIPSFERIPKSELPARCSDGYVMEIPLVTTPIYLNYLLERFRLHGGQVEQREIQSLAELAQPQRIIVNCSGVWARKVANDPDVFPIRGQVVKVNAPYLQVGFIDDEEFTYILPRLDGVVLGGVAQVDNWSLQVDPALTHDILRDAEILAQPVGLRPGRHEVRLECEAISDSCAILHNYGHGTIGYTLSWGCAQEVVELATQVASTWS